MKKITKILSVFIMIFAITSGISYAMEVKDGKINGEKVVTIQEHDGHYHLTTESGTEYVVEENPSEQFPDIEITKYSGEEHGDEHNHDHEEENHNHEEENHDHEESHNHDHEEGHDHEDHDEISLSDLPDGYKDKEPVSIKQHGDHWDLTFEDGTTLVTHDNPKEVYPNIEIEIEDEKDHNLNQETNTEILNETTKEDKSSNNSLFYIIGGVVIGLVIILILAKLLFKNKK